MVRFLFKSLSLPFPFYTYIKQIFEYYAVATGPSRGHLLECGALCLAILHLAILQLSINFNLVGWDPVASYLYLNRHLYGNYVFACASCLTFYVLLTNWLLFLKTADYTFTSRSTPSSATSWQALAYDLIVRNVDQAKQCIKSERPQNITENQKWVFKHSPLDRFKAYLSSIIDKLSLKHLDLGKLGRSHSQLSICSFFSVEHRKKILQFHAASSLVFGFLQFAYLLPLLLMVSILIIIQVSRTAPETIPLSGWLLLLHDLLLITAFSWLLYRNVLLFIYFDLIASFAFRWHLQTGHRKLAYLIRKYATTCTSSLNSWKRLLLRSLLTEHARICALADTCNRQIISLASFSALLCNCPTNIYLIYRVIYMKILLSEGAVIILVTVLQLLCLAFALVPLAQANRALAQTAKYLPGVQLYVLRGGNCRALKMKYDILQGALCESRVQSGATIGPLCLITFEALYKVVSLYAVYMLAFFGLLTK